MFKISPPDHLLGRGTGEVLHGLVPDDHRAGTVEGKGWFREKIDDIGEPVF